jgi:membrane-associated protease RseP (regulator of RpoE activity)
MFQQSHMHRYQILKLGGLAAAILFTATQVWAQNDAAPAGTAQANETSVLLPPPTPPQAEQSNPAQPSKEAFMQPSAPQQPSAQATPGQVNPGQPTVLPQPQPPRNDMTNQTDARSLGRAQLGVNLVPTDGAGVRISAVMQGTAAEAAGLRPGDIVLAMNGQPAVNPQDVIGRIRAMNVGDAVELRIWRNGVEQTVNATLGEMRSAPLQTEYSLPASGYLESGVQPYYYPSGRVYRRYYGYYPGTYIAPYGYYGRSYYYGYPFGGMYYGTPRFGYYNSPWGQGVRIGSFGFGWR